MGKVFAVQMRDSEFGASKPTKARHDSISCNISTPMIRCRGLGRYRRRPRTLGKAVVKKGVFFSNKVEVKTETQACSAVSTCAVAPVPTLMCMNSQTLRTIACARNNCPETHKDPCRLDLLFTSNSSTRESGVLFCCQVAPGIHIVYRRT